MNMDLIDSALNRLDLKGKTQDTALANEVARATNIENLKANIESPIFTGTPKAPTAPANTNDTQIATTAFVKAVVNALVNGAPETLDTLKEIADAISENKDMSDALNAAIGNKVDKVDGKELSTNDYTTEEKDKLSGIDFGAEVNVQADWNVADANNDAFIKNKPVIPINTSQLTNNSGFLTTESLDTRINVRYIYGNINGNGTTDNLKTLGISCDLTVLEVYNKLPSNCVAVIQNNSQQTTYSTSFPKNEGAAQLTYQKSGNRGTIIFIPIHGTRVWVGKVVNEEVVWEELSVKGEIIVNGDADLNNYTESGVYYFGTGGNIVNIPIGVNGWLVVMSYGNHGTKQLWFRYGTPDKNNWNTYERLRSGNTWSKWSRIMTEHDVPTLEITGEYNTLTELWTVANRVFESSISKTILLRFKDTGGWTPVQSWWRAIVSAQNVMGRKDYGVDGSIILHNSKHIYFGTVTGGEVDASNLTVAWRSVDTSTILIGTLAANTTSIAFTNTAITDAATIDIYTDVFGVNPTNITINGNKITLTFAARSAATNVKVKIS